VVTEPRSYTGRYLAPLLGRGAAGAASARPERSAERVVEGRSGDGSSDPDEGAAAPKRVRRRKSEAVAAE